MPERRSADLVDQDLQRSVRAAHAEQVSVTFPSTANADAEIKYKNLRPVNVEAIQFRVVEMKLLANPTNPPVVWKYIGTDRRKWGSGYVILRCTEASAQAVIELSIKRPI